MTVPVSTQSGLPEIRRWAAGARPWGAACAPPQGGVLTPSRNLRRKVGRVDTRSGPHRTNLSVAIPCNRLLRPVGPLSRLHWAGVHIQWQTAAATQEAPTRDISGSRTNTVAPRAVLAVLGSVGPHVWTVAGCTQRRGATSAGGRVTCAGGVSQWREKACKIWRVVWSFQHFRPN